MAISKYELEYQIWRKNKHFEFNNNNNHEFSNKTKEETLESWIRQAFEAGRKTEARNSCKICGNSENFCGDKYMNEIKYCCPECKMIPIYLKLK